MVKFQKKFQAKKVLDMILFLFQKIKKLHFGQMSKSKKLKMDHRFLAFKKLRKKIKI